MLARNGSNSGLLVLGSLLVFGQLGLLSLLILRLSDNVPRADLTKVIRSDSSTVNTRDVRTVQSPPVKVEADETTEYVP